MSDSRLEELLDEAARLLPGGDGRVEIEERPDRIYVRGDREGFLRLGVGLARGMFRPSTANHGLDHTIDTATQELFREDHLPVVFQRVERWPPRLPESRLGRGARTTLRITRGLAVLAALTLCGLGVLQLVLWFGG